MRVQCLHRAEATVPFRATGGLPDAQGRSYRENMSGEGDAKDAGPRPVGRSAHLTESGVS